MERPSDQHIAHRRRSARDCPRAEVSTVAPPQEEARKRGPQKAPRKVPLSIRLFPEIVEAFRASGPGWQQRMNLALLQWLSANSPTDVALPDRRGQPRKTQ
ncbi:BrnA antitoxin family protein [Cupriavidus sp. NPDC089707]|uniref:BrnA antitoxin family protein n=1 Tax=Cupriavidus sp. NPDC089707 TaxID=3363963 RepID=UPI00382FF368